MKERKANRLAGFDYSTDALYFVTSCVKDRICCFGEVINQEMICNEFGKIAEMQWEWLQNQYPYIISHAFVVMPNHIHAVLEINRNLIVGTEQESSIVGTGRDLSLQLTIPRKIKSISELIGAYKTTTSKKIHLAGYAEFQWQRSFHDHIIRNEKAYMQIVNYIETNPLRWEKDTFFS